MNFQHRVAVIGGGSFGSEDDAFIMPDLEQMLGKRLDCEPTPSELLV